MVKQIRKAVYPVAGFGTRDAEGSAGMTEFQVSK